MFILSFYILRSGMLGVVISWLYRVWRSRVGFHRYLGRIGIYLLTFINLVNTRTSIWLSVILLMFIEVNRKTVPIVK